MKFRLAICTLAGAALFAHVSVLTAGFAGSAPSRQAPAGTPELLLDQGKRLFDAFQYDQAIPVFDRLIATLTAGGQSQRLDMLVPAYELRARARFALGDSTGTEQDFAALLVLKPDFRLGAISPRVVAVFEAVRRVTIGQVSASMTSLGEVQIDGRPYTIGPDPQMIDLPAGEHQATINRPGYRPVAEKFTVTASAVVSLGLVLDRVSATLSIVTVPEGVSVVLDGTPRGETQAATGPGELSAPLLLNELQTGAHRLQLHRNCYKDLERTITIERPEDVAPGPLRLTPAIATVRIQAGDRGAAVFLDGVSRGQVPTEFTVCEGSHTIEVKGANGRFIDRRDWKTGDAATLTADLRSAFAIVAVKGPLGAAADQVRVNLERALAPARRMLVYAPPAVELDAALRSVNLPVDWWADDPAQGAAGARLPKEARRDLARTIAAQLGAQGVAAITTGPDPTTLTVFLLAAGSGDPDVVTINLADTSSLGRGVAMLSAKLPSIIEPSIDAAVVDVAGVQGAVVVRVAAGAANAGLAPGDVIVGAGGAPITSVADFRAWIEATHPPAGPLPLDVKRAGSAARKVDVPVNMVPDTLPLRDPAVVYNLALIDLQNAATTAVTPLERAAAHLNLAIVHMRLGNWDDAQIELKRAPLPEGAGVSAGTVAYLTGLCFEAAGKTAEAREAFTKAAAAPLARLGNDGALVAPLAQQRLRR